MMSAEIAQFLTINLGIKLLIFLWVVGCIVIYFLENYNKKRDERLCEHVKHANGELEKVKNIIDEVDAEVTQLKAEVEKAKTRRMELQKEQQQTQSELIGV